MSFRIALGGQRVYYQGIFPFAQDEKLSFGREHGVQIVVTSHHFLKSLRESFFRESRNVSLHEVVAAYAAERKLGIAPVEIRLLHRAEFKRLESFVFRNYARARILRPACCGVFNGEEIFSERAGRVVLHKRFGRDSQRERVGYFFRETNQHDGAYAVLQEGAVGVHAVCGNAGGSGGQSENHVCQLCGAVDRCRDFFMLCIVEYIFVMSLFGELLGF